MMFDNRIVMIRIILWNSKVMPFFRPMSISFFGVCEHNKLNKFNEGDLVFAVEGELSTQYDFSTTCCWNSFPLLPESLLYATRLLGCSLAVSRDNEMSHRQNYLSYSTIEGLSLQQLRTCIYPNSHQPKSAKTGSY
jgi:hypothetical protein